MDREDKKIVQWAKNLPYIFASCGSSYETKMAKELVEFLIRLEKADEEEKAQEKTQDTEA